MILPLHILAGGLGLLSGYVALYAFAVLLPMFAIAYWLWRLRVRRPVHRHVGVSAPQATAIAQVQL